MLRPPIAALVLLLGAPSIAQDDSASAAARLRALLDEYRADGGSFRKATTDAERNAAVAQMDRFALRFVALLEHHPADPVALDVALEAIRSLNAVESLTQGTFTMNEKVFPTRGRDDLAGRGVAVLERNHLRSERLGPICLRMSYGLRPEFEAFLRAVVRANPAREVRAIACLALAQLRHARLLKLALVSDRPELADRYADLFGRERFAAWCRQDRVAASREVEALFERCSTEYGEVAHPYGGTIGERARSELFEIRHLAAGKLAPEIEGVDQDGHRFKLSDYRGRVVLLDFWQEH